MKKKHLSTVGLVLFAVLMTAMQLYAQKTNVRVDGGIIKEYITYMADDGFLGRRPNTPEMAQCQEWAKNLFVKWGLEPGGEDGSYYQAVPIGRTYTFSTGVPTLIINGREFYAKFRDFTVSEYSTAGKKVKGEIVFVGYGISAPAKGLDEYADVDVKGKVVFVYRGSPNDVQQPRNRFAPEGGGAEAEGSVEDWAVESQDSTKIKTAYQKGAAAIVMYDPAAESEGAGRGRRGSSIENISFTRDFIIVSEVSDRVYQWLFWDDPQESSGGFQRRMDGMRLDIKEKKARSHNTDARAEIGGFERTDIYGEKYGNHKCRNVIAKITGSDPVLKNEYVVMGGHFDHLGVRNGQVYNGADDNASGSAVVMEVARLMRAHNIKTKRTVYFCLWTGEELGLIGSRYWVNNPTDGVTMDKVVTYFNMDMVGLGDKIGAPGALNFLSSWEIIKKHQDQDILDAIEASEGGPGGSDHSGFIELGIEALALMTSGGGGHPDYHDTGDDAALMEAEILRKTGQFVLQGTINLANESGTLVIADRQHLFDAMRWNITCINPALEARGGWTTLRAEDQDDLGDLIVERFAEVRRSSATSTGRPAMMMMATRRPPSRANNNLGIAGPVVFDYDIDYLYMARAVLGFGRIDINGDDGRWFKEGITAEGRSALAALEDSSIVLNLINPSAVTLDSVIAAAKKSFLVSGSKDLTPAQIAAINEKNILVTVEFDPENVSDCVSRLEGLKGAFGDTDNLVLFITSQEGLDEAKKELYMRLINKGWDKADIYAIGGSVAGGGGGRGGFGGGGGGNLRRLGR